jgi:hypothetical protein
MAAVEVERNKLRSRVVKMIGEKSYYTQNHPKCPASGADQSEMRIGRPVLAALHAPRRVDSLRMW